MRSWFLLIVGALVGCQSDQVGTLPEAPLVKVVENKDKDAYIERLENEASEASAALTASVRCIPFNRELVDLTITRLTGIRQPTQKQVDKFEQACKDKGLLKTEQVKASKVEEETDSAWLMVAQVDAENNELRDKIKLMEERRKQEQEEQRMANMMNSITKTCQWVGSLVLLAGVGLMIAGSWIGKMSKAGGLCIVIGGATILLPMVIPTIITSAWFSYSIGGLVIISVGWALYDGLHTHQTAKGGSKPRIDP